MTSGVKKVIHNTSFNKKIMTYPRSYYAFLGVTYCCHN